MSTFHGIAVYKYKGDGCLNGIWSNSGTIGSLMNECLKKVDDAIGDDCICGEYKMTYMEADGTTINGKVIITKKGHTYQFDWYKDSGKQMFTGIGLKTGKSHYSVSYIKV